VLARIVSGGVVKISPVQMLRIFPEKSGKTS
jgi:hypothetical protein